ncbi:MAG: DEAD/DEAH box helicase [Thiotrichaceae bacterium IS1]|nr:MAG: DEAD/DEAH box helicase [Thiotrichaceae bacterium IS1]
MYDLLGAYQRLDRIYQLYIKSAFPLRYRALAEERDKLLKQPGLISQPPLVEPLPIYPSSGRDLLTAASQLSPEYRDLAPLAQHLFDHGTSLYQHQWQSLQEVLVKRRDLVVTTGTGSGKTECFLLPLLAQLANESQTWPASPPPPENYQWWNSDKAQNRVSQWAHVKRPTALRALILYPLNALVEDQLRRLRKTLEQDSVYDWLDKFRGGNRITFGRYTSQTLVAGPKNKDKLKELSKELREWEQQRQQILEALRQNAALDQDMPYYFPRIDGGEMWSRWDMQECPPDVLITNYSMLNIMLMRSIEDNLFAATRAWLAEPQHPERQFFLIVDELHTYRGTPGTEVAYILRLLLGRLGLSVDSPQLRILATTASLEENASGRKFLREFFGRDNFAFIASTQTPPQENTRFQLAKHHDAFAEFATTVKHHQPRMLPPEPTTPAIQEAMVNLVTQLQSSVSSSLPIPQQLGETLQQLQVPDALRDACQAVHGSVRATGVNDLDKQLFPEVSHSDLVSDAMHGLLLALGMSQLATGRTPQPVRSHLFFHNLQGLWACCNPNCNDESVNLPRRQAEKNVSPLGAIHTHHSLVCSCGSRILDLIVCEVCGEVFLGGYKRPDTRGKKFWVLTPDQPDLENIPDRVNLSQRYQEYALLWPVPSWNIQPQDMEWSLDKIKRQWVKAKLHRNTGVLVQNSSPPNSNNEERTVWCYQIVGEHPSESALPSKCPRCDADYGKHKFPSPLRFHRTPFQKSTQVVARGVLREIPAPPSQTNRSSRKLVIFSDSRQDAAKLAAGMELDHYRDLVYLSLIQSFQSYWGELEAFLRVTCASNPSSLTKLQMLNPKLFQTVTTSPQPQDMEKRNRFSNANSNLIGEALQWVMDLPPSNPPARDQWLEVLRQYPNRISLLSLRHQVRDALLNLGICPGGSSFRAIKYPVGQNGGKEWREWFTCYDWTHGTCNKLVNPTTEQELHIQYLETKLMEEFMLALFRHVARTFEGVGQGWVSYLPQGSPLTKVIEATEAVIRQLGTRRSHRYSPYFRPGNISDLPAFARNYLGNAGLSPEEVSKQLLNSKAGLPSANQIVLDPNGLYLMPPVKENQGYRCPQCHAFYLHDAAGICPECSDKRSTKTLARMERGEKTTDFDYYNYLSEDSGEPFGMRADELTGQTDRQERVKRQRWFQEIFLQDEIPLVQGIDLLSVTTTMEAGVDIGALLAVMMSNMPPRRFNYQQRVGRAGRRSTGVALAVTFCRGRSHDDFYFQRPESITGDPPPSPYVDLRSQEIFRRVFIKEVLRQAFAKCSVPVNSEERDKIHGEFGQAKDWPSYKDHISNWLKLSENQVHIKQVFDALCVQTALSVKAEELITYLNNQLVNDITAIAADSSYTQDALSERLANAGLLPMFGFPTRVRPLYTRWPSQGHPWPPQQGVIDRNLDIALSQFAPGSQTVKDKAVHTACGVVNLYPHGGKVVSESGLTPPLPQGNPYILGLCSHCQAVVYPHPSISLAQPPSGEQILRLDTCPVCGKKDALRCLDAREPKGFFTDLQPEDYDGQFEWQPRSTRPSLSIPKLETELPHFETVCNAKVASWNDHIISVNDNGGEGGFDFQRASVYGKERNGAYAVSTGKDSVSTTGPKYRIALLSRRKTDILLVNIAHWPAGIAANPTTLEERAAWYSLAFWLRQAAGALLDIDPQELQASFRALSEENQPIGEAFLGDQLENGAGYCRFLAQPEEFKKLLQQANPLVNKSIAQQWLTHSDECDTSCNRCLRDYHNLAYHGLLDWRLALDMARLIMTPDNVPDLHSPWGNSSNPWTALVEERLPKTLKGLGYTSQETFGNLKGYRRKQQILLMRHPLWQDDYPGWAEAVQMVQQKYSGSEIRAGNPWLILRRPGEYA